MHGLRAVLFHNTTKPDMQFHIQKIVDQIGCTESEANEISRTIDEQFSDFFWSSATNEEISTIIHKAVYIQQLLAS